MQVEENLEQTCTLDAFHHHVAKLDQGHNPNTLKGGLEFVVWQAKCKLQQTHQIFRVLSEIAMLPLLGKALCFRSPISSVVGVLTLLGDLL
jgi:hypothetical protein